MSTVNRSWAPIYFRYFIVVYTFAGRRFPMPCTSSALILVRTALTCYDQLLLTSLWNNLLDNLYITTGYLENPFWPSRGSTRISNPFLSDDIEQIRRLSYLHIWKCALPFSTVLEKERNNPGGSIMQHVPRSLDGTRLGNVSRFFPLSNLLVSVKLVRE